MPTFTANELADATGGTWTDRLPPPEAVAGVSTDTRQVQPGELFLALRGARFDGHDFVEAATARGAAALCLEEERAGACPVLRVPDTLRAYQDLAAWHRQRFPTLMRVALTGSSGKTSTKEMIAAILRAHLGDVLATVGNTNNLIGVPQNLLRLGPEHRAAVLELGTSQPGEIALLADLAKADVAVLTNIGPAHLEGLSLPGDQGLAGVAREKSAIFQRLGERGGRAVLPLAWRHDPFVREALGETPALTFGPEEGADLRVARAPTAAGQRLTIRRAARPPLALDLPLAGAHQALNAAAAVGVATWLEIPDATIAAALAELALPGMRMHREQHDGVEWINDAYNANPDSVRALVTWLAELPPPSGRLWLALGDMRELGAAGPAWHRETLSAARQALPTAELLAVGPEMSQAAPTVEPPPGGAFATVAEARAWLLPQLAPGDRVALKASRGMALEGLLPEAPES